MTKHMIFQVGIAPIKGKEDQLHTIMFREDQGELLPFRAYFDFQQGCWIQTKSGNKIETGEGVPKLFYLDNATPIGDASKEYGIVPLSQAPKTDSEVFKAFVIKVNPEGKIDGVLGFFKNKKWYDKEDKALQDRETLEYVCPIEWVEENKKAVEKEQIERILSDKPFEAPVNPFTKGSEPKVDWIKEAGETPAADALLEGVEMNVIPKGIKGDSFKYPVEVQEAIDTANSIKVVKVNHEIPVGTPFEEGKMPQTAFSNPIGVVTGETSFFTNADLVIPLGDPSRLKTIPFGIELDLTRLVGSKNMSAKIVVHEVLPTGAILHTNAKTGLNALIADPYEHKWVVKHNGQIVFSYE